MQIQKVEKFDDLKELFWKRREAKKGCGPVLLRMTEIAETFEEWLWIYERAERLYRHSTRPSVREFYQRIALQALRKMKKLAETFIQLNKLLEHLSYKDPDRKVVWEELVEKATDFEEWERVYRRASNRYLPEFNYGIKQEALAKMKALAHTTSQWLTLYDIASTQKEKQQALEMAAKTARTFDDWAKLVTKRVCQELKQVCVTKMKMLARSFEELRTLSWYISPGEIEEVLTRMMSVASTFDQWYEILKLIKRHKSFLSNPEQILKKVKTQLFALATEFRDWRSLYELAYTITSSKKEGEELKRRMLAKMLASAKTHRDLATVWYEARWIESSEIRKQALEKLVTILNQMSEWERFEAILEIAERPYTPLWRALKRKMKK